MIHNLLSQAEEHQSGNYGFKYRVKSKKYLVFIRPTALITRKDSDNNTTLPRIFCTSEDNHKIGLPGGKTKLPKLVQGMKDVLTRTNGELFEHIGNAGHAGNPHLMNWYNSQHSLLLRLELLRELDEEINMAPSRNIADFLATRTNLDDLIPKEEFAEIYEYRRYLRSIASAKHPKCPFISSIEPKILYFEQINDSALIILPIYAVQFSGGNSSITRNKPTGELTERFWASPTDLVSPNYQTPNGNEKEVHQSIIYLAQKLIEKHQTEQHRTASRKTLEELTI